MKHDIIADCFKIIQHHYFLKNKGISRKSPHLHETSKTK